MSDDPIMQAIADQNAAADAAEAAAQAPEPVAAEAAPESGADTASSPEWRQKFADEDTMWKSYQHSQAAMTQAQQQRAELERAYADLQSQLQQPQEDPYAPFGGLPPGADDIAQMAAEDPGQAYWYVLSNPQQFGWQADKIAAEIFQQWMFTNPRQAIAYEHQRLAAEMQAQQAAQIEPVQQHYIAQMQDQAIQWAQRELPDFDAYSADIAALLAKNPSRYQQVIGEKPDPQSMIETIKEAYARARFERFDTQRRQPAPAQAAAPPASTASQTRSTSGAPTESGDDVIRQAILNATR